MYEVVVIMHTHVTGSSSVPQSDDASDADAGVRQTEVPAGWWGESWEHLVGLFFLQILIVLTEYIASFVHLGAHCAHRFTESSDTPPSSGRSIKVFKCLSVLF